MLVTERMDKCALILFSETLPMWCYIIHLLTYSLADLTSSIWNRVGEAVAEGRVDPMDGGVVWWVEEESFPRFSGVRHPADQLRWIAIDDVLLSSPNLTTSVQNYLRKMEPEFQLLRERVRQNQLEANG